MLTSYEIRRERLEILLEKKIRLDRKPERCAGLAAPFLRALIRSEVSCLGKGCQTQVYTLAAHAGDYWANMFYLAWLVLALGYALYVTLKIWFRA